MNKRFPIYKRQRNVKGKRYRFWIVDCGLVEGRRKVKQFSKRTDAENFQARMRKEERQLGESAYQLAPDTRRDAVRALEILHGQTSLTEAATFYSQHHIRQDRKITFSLLLDEYVAAKRKADRRARTILEVRDKLGRFAEEFGAQKVAEITTQDVIRWLDSRHYRGTTRRAYRGLLHGIFNYALDTGVVSANPITTIPKPSPDARMIDIFTVEEVEKLLLVCERERPEMVPYFALGIFAGLRPENELQNLEWRNINLKTRSIRIVPHTAKKRRQRIVEITPNLKQWLVRFQNETGKIFFSRRQYRTVRRIAGVKWSTDIMRHTYGSYHLAMFENAAKTSLQMGHITTDILFNYYRDLVTKADAKRFWNIEPSRGANIVRFKLEAM